MHDDELVILRHTIHITYCWRQQKSLTGVRDRRHKLGAGYPGHAG